MFGGMIGDKASVAKLLASGNASADVILGRVDLIDHLNNNCNVGANLRYFLQFTEKNLPRILAAVQKPANANSSFGVGPSGGRFFDHNDPGGSNTLLGARNATALLVKYCQCCEKRSGVVLKGAMSGAVATPSHDSPLGKVVPVMIGLFSRRGELPDSVALDIQRILLAAIETDHETTLHNINITLRSDIVSGAVRHLSSSMTISETLVSLFGSALNAKAMMMEVADPSAFVVRWVEHDFHTRLVNHLSSAMRNIDCAPYFFFFQEMLKRAFSPNVGPMVDQILSEVCFGKLFDIAVSAAEDMLKVRKKKGAKRGDHSDLRSLAASDNHSTEGSESTNNTELSILVEGETPPIGSIPNDSVGRTISGISLVNVDGAEEGVEYPYLAEALNLVFQCVGIIRRSLPPPESESVYMSRRLPLSHGPVHVMLRYLPRLVNILKSAVPSHFRPSSYIVRRHRSVVEKLRRQAGDSVSVSASENGEVAPFHTDAMASVRSRKEGPVISPSLVPGSDFDCEDVVRVDDDENASDTSAAGASNAKQRKSGGAKSSSKEKRNSTVGALSNVNESSNLRETRAVFGSARLAITDIIVELTLFRSRVCDEALVASGAIEVLLDCAEVFANHDLLLRNVHRVIMAVMQRPAYSEISLASNVTAAIAANEAAQKTMAQQQQQQQAQTGGGGAHAIGSVAIDKGGLSSNLSFASNTFENGKDAHPSFMGLDDLRQQYSSSSLTFGEDEETDEDEHLGITAGDDGDRSQGHEIGGWYDTHPSIDDELHFWGGKTIVARKGPAFEDASPCNNGAETRDSKAKTRGPAACRRRHPHLLSKNRREALEAEKMIERQILQRLDRETLSMVHIDPLVRLLIQKRPLTELLYAWASTPESMSVEEQALMPDGQKQFRNFTNTSLQVHATQMIQRLKEVGASQAIKSECGETLHCNDEIASKLLLWQRPITGDRFVDKGSGCTETIVHRPVVVHRENDYSLLHDEDEEDTGDYGVSSGTSTGESSNLDFDADNLISGRSRASNNDASRAISESPEKRSSSSGSLDDFQNEDVTGEAAALISPRRRSNSIGREHRYAAAYELDEDIGNSSGGLFTEDSSFLGFGVNPGILKDEPGHLETSQIDSSVTENHHRDPFTNLSAAADDFASPVVTRPRSHLSNGPPELANSPDKSELNKANTSDHSDSAQTVEDFDESAFETRELVDLSTNLETADSNYERYFENVPEFRPAPASSSEWENDCRPNTEESPSTHDAYDGSNLDSALGKKRSNSTNKYAVAIKSDDEDDDESNQKYKFGAEADGNTPTVCPSAKFKVTYTGKNGRSSSAPRTSISPSSNNGTDDSFELDEEAIGIIEKTRGVSVDSSVDSDTADMILDRSSNEVESEGMSPKADEKDARDDTSSNPNAELHENQPQAEQQGQKH